MKFILKLEKLEKGDIVLESGHTKIVSPTIKKITNSNFSHAMLYVGGTLIHSVGGGVFSKNPQRILVDSENKLKVLRLKDRILSEKINEICGYARDKVGALYSKTEAMAAVLYNKSKKEQKNRKQYCSRLVAQSYANAGVSLVENENYCSPEDLNLSSKLIEVPDCIVEAKKEEIEFANSPDPNMVNQSETFKWLKKARMLYKKERIDIQTLNDVAQALLDNRKYDKTICKYIQSTKYLNLYNVDRVHNPYRYDKDKFKERLNSYGSENLLENEIHLNEGEFERHEVNLTLSRLHYKNSKIKHFKLHIKLYRNLLLEVKKRLVVIDELLSEFPEENLHFRVSSLRGKVDNLLF